MASIITKPFDFYIYNMYFAIGMENMFTTPVEAMNYGMLLFFGQYLLIMLLIGIPAFAEETSYFMLDECTQSKQTQKWSRGYHVITLMQYTQMIVPVAFSVCSMGIMQLYALVGTDSYDILQLYSPSCTLHGINGTDSNSALLQPSCLQMDSSPLACKALTLITSPQRILYYSMIMLSIVLVVYIMSFGDTWHTNFAAGRLYLILILLCCGTLLLHFFSAPKTKDMVKRNTNIDRNIIDTDTSYKIFFRCMYSLSLGLFCVSIIGSRAGEVVKRSFVSLTAAVCVSDFGIILMFSAVAIMRRSAVDALCGFEKTDELLKFMSLPNGTESQNLMVDTSILEMAESILMFRECSGYIPWTVYLPFQILVLIFTTMLVCNYFLVGDLQAARVFKKRKRFVVLISVIRFGLLLMLNWFSLAGIFKELFNFMIMSTYIMFFLLKTIECVSIHLGQGFREYLRERKKLIPDSNYIQAFIFNWYLGPAILYLFNMGYPMLVVIIMVDNYELIVSLNFAVYFVFVNAVPTLIIMIVAHCD